MNQIVARPRFQLNVETVVSLILSSQKDTGEIPWFHNEKTDPWDMVEAAMGLNIAGYRNRALNAYQWLKESQNPDGSWYAAYRNGQPEDRTKDTNMTSYIAVGVWHDYLIHQDRSFLKSMWKTICAAMSFVLSHQDNDGQIWWAVSPEGIVDKMALLTGSSSIYMSLKCAILIATVLEYDCQRWKTSLKKLGQALLCPQLFNMTKSRYSMDWFYPILCGAITGKQAIERIQQKWDTFVVEEQGVRCVSDRPWVTVAETCEFCIALAAIGNQKTAETVFNWICDKRHEDGSYWCGFTCPDMVIWPIEKTTWTNAVVLLAADAIFQLTPGCQLFDHQYWEQKKSLCFS